MQGGNAAAPEEDSGAGRRHHRNGGRRHEGPNIESKGTLGRESESENAHDDFFELLWTTGDDTRGAQHLASPRARSCRRYQDSSP